MTWINFLHLYQPANIDDFHIEEAYNKSYSRLLRLLEENKNLHLTFNISGCLLERLSNMGKDDFINGIKKMIESGRLELVSSAAFHPLLPLIPKREIEQQIKDNEDILNKLFGPNFKPRGFFMPEMAYSAEVAQVVKSFGYEWIILDEISVDNKNNFDKQRPYIDEASGLKVIFRNREFSRAYPPDMIFKMLNKENADGIYISATDGELYGLRHEDPTNEMGKIADSDKVITKTISHFIDEFDNNLDSISLRESSWESTENEIREGLPFKLWLNKKNRIHKLMWELSHIAFALDDKYKNDENYYWYRWHLNRGVASCNFWWASAHDFSEDFGPYTWSPDAVERGLEDLIRSFRSIANPNSIKDKLKAEKKYLLIKKFLWQEHWEKHWLKMPK